MIVLDNLSYAQRLLVGQVLQVNLIVGDTSDRLEGDISEKAVFLS